MLERRSLPGFGCVAQRAVTPKLTAMHIILDVTADTVRRRAAEDIVDMALLAFHLHSAYPSLERRQVVIKDFVGQPSVLWLRAQSVQKFGGWGIVLQKTSSTVGLGRLLKAARLVTPGWQSMQRTWACLPSSGNGQLVMCQTCLLKKKSVPSAGPAVRAIFLHVNTGKAFIFFAVAGSQRAGSKRVSRSV